MVDKLQIRRSPFGKSLTGTQLEEELKAEKVPVLHRLETAVITQSKGVKVSELEKKGYRIKRLPDTNILSIGKYRIDIGEGAPRVSPSLDVTKSKLRRWTHYLVQLAGRAESQWISRIEERGIKVIETIPPYGLFVVGDHDSVQQLRAFPFVEWTGHFKPAYRLSPRLQKMRGTIRYVNIGVLADGDIDDVKKEIDKSQGIIIQDESLDRKSSDKFITIVAELHSRSLNKIARLRDVHWLDYQPQSILLDERSCQIVAEDLDANVAPNTGPNTGFANTLNNLDVDGNGVIIAICDSGVDTHNNTNMQADLAGLMAFFIDQTGGSILVDRNGHGTHVAAIAVGSGTSGDTDPQGFIIGQGVAPGANFGSINAIAGGVPMNLNNWCQAARTNGSDVMNNSWGAATALGVALINQGYTALCRTLDQLIRDPNNNAAVLENMVIIFAAGNAGSALSTMGEPCEAKNAITVGNSLNFRPGEGDIDDIRGLRTSSSRGPAVDNRTLPNVVAPGTNIISARPGPTVDSDPATPGVQQPRNAYTDTGGTVHNDHYSNTGTSMAAPHVAGICALLIEWWRNRTNEHTPSQALLKALLINGAIDIAGGPDRRGGNIGNIPNNDQGWGRVSLENILLQAPDSDRGPKIFSDQRHAFTADGQEYLIRVAAADNTRPLRITLTWTDAAGAVNANPALLNDLDLEVTEVTELVTGDVYKGNINFVNGFSTPAVPGDDFDDRNNIECVFIENPNGTYEVRVIAASLDPVESAHPNITAPWQDFALVIDNAEVPSTTPVGVVPVIDRSRSMVTSEYVDITKISSKQFVDLMGIDDMLGVVSFGYTGKVEYPTGASPALQTITGPETRDDANNEIEGIAFGGCTYMGDGIVKARDLLASAATGSRALILLSDGYDNKGCDESNPQKLWAVDAAATLPADLPIYTCAMGPASDQDLLAQLADDTNGLYYYMPTIDDLFEIYNYIRGQVTSDSIIVNDSSTASKSRVAGFVDACASTVTFTVAWADTSIRYVPHEPIKANEINIRLRDPNGRLLHNNATNVHRIVGSGYVVFRILEPLAGRWYVEVETARNYHMRYTVGGFVDSSIRMSLPAISEKIVRGMPLKIITQVLDDDRLITGYKTMAKVIAPVDSVPKLLRKYSRQLKSIRVNKRTAREVPPDIARLLTLRAKLLNSKKVDILRHEAFEVPVFERSAEYVKGQRLGHLLSPDHKTSGLSIPTSSLARNVALASSRVLHGGFISPVDVPVRISGISIGQFDKTIEEGTYNVIVKVSGVSPWCNTRFERQQLVSVLVR